MKKLFVCFFTLLIVVTLVMGSAFSASAKTYNFKLNSGWGTKESGIITKTPNYHLEHTPYNETPGFPNGDFEQGLMYFIVQAANRHRRFKFLRIAMVTTMVSSLPIFSGVVLEVFPL